MLRNNRSKIIISFICKVLLLPGFIVLALNGCAYFKGVDQNANYEEIKNEIKTEKDSYGKNNVYGPPIYLSDSGIRVSTYTRYQLYYNANDNNYFLKVTVKYHFLMGGGWLYLNSVYAKGGDKMPTINYDGLVNSCSGYSCSYTEGILVKVTDTLQKHKTNSFKIKFKRYEGIIIKFSKDYVSALVDYVSAHYNKNTLENKHIYAEKHNKQVQKTDNTNRSSSKGIKEIKARTINLDELHDQEIKECNQKLKSMFLDNKRLKIKSLSNISKKNLNDKSSYRISYDATVYSKNIQKKIEITCTITENMTSLRYD